MLRFIVFFYLLGLATACAHQESNVELVVSDLGVPWGMTFINDQRLLVTEKSGSTKIVDTQTGGVKEVVGSPNIDIIGQGGLMDVATSPNFAVDSVLYFTYAKPVETLDEDGTQVTNYATSLASAKLNGVDLTDWQDLFVSNVQTNSGRHFGSRIAFDRTGHIFFGHGDRGQRQNAQDLSNHGGTIIRLNLDGSIPSDNPFVDSPEAQSEIWSYGHRNPQGLFYDHANQRLWSNEHGPKGGDEINLIVKGGNYGWPLLSYGAEYGSGDPVSEATEGEGYVSPMKYYDPSIAPSSLIVYTGDKFPQLKGSLLSSALVLRHLNVVELDQKGNEISEIILLKALGERIRNVAQSPSGEIFIATDSGDIYKLLNVLDQ